MYFLISQNDPRSQQDGWSLCEKLKSEPIEYYISHLTVMSHNTTNKWLMLKFYLIVSKLTENKIQKKKEKSVVLILNAWLNIHYSSSNMLIWCSRDISYYYQIWKHLCSLIFSCNLGNIFSRILEKVQNTCTNDVIFEQFNAFLLNKSIDFFQTLQTFIHLVYSLIIYK